MVEARKCRVQFPLPVYDSLLSLLLSMITPCAEHETDRSEDTTQNREQATILGTDLIKIIHNKHLLHTQYSPLG